MEEITVEEFKDLFNLFDGDNDGIVEKTEFREILNTLNLDTSIINESTEDEQFFTFDDLWSLIKSDYSDIGPKEVKSAFTIFSSLNNDKVDLSEFLHMLIEYGEGFSVDEIEEVVRDFTDDDNKILVNEIAKAS